MGILRHVESNEPTLLPARCLVGRAPACDLRVRNRLVSGEHATLWWADDAWWVRDLGSRNGTRIGDRRLNVGIAERLESGQRLSFGDQIFVLESGAPPVVGAVAMDDGTVVNGLGNLLALPSTDDPVATLFQASDGRWVAEIGEETRAVANLEVIEVSGRLFRLQLPQSVDSTMEAEDVPVSVLTPEYVFRVSLDEEHVELTLNLPDGQSVDLPDRVHMYALVVLARARLADAELPPTEQGWVDRTRLCRMLAMDRKHLNLQLFRARKQLADAGFEGVGELIQRRSTQLRFGPRQVVMRPPGGGR